MGEKEKFVCDACGKGYIYIMSFYKHLDNCSKRREAIKPFKGGFVVGSCGECKLWRELNQDHVCVKCALHKAGLKTYGEWVHEIRDKDAT